MGRLLPILFLIDVALVVIALISCLSAEDSDIRALPRFAWVLIILLFPPVGPIAWFVAGRERYSRPQNVWSPGRGFPENERPRTVAPDDNPDFLRGIAAGRAEREAKAAQERERETLRKWEEDLRRREEDLRRRDKTDD
jgi:Phospholipase_D-nuclease N-terminal